MLYAPRGSFFSLNKIRITYKKKSKPSGCLVCEASVPMSSISNFVCSLELGVILNASSGLAKSYSVTDSTTKNRRKKKFKII